MCISTMSLCLCVCVCVYPNSSQSVSSLCQVVLRLWKHSQFWECEALVRARTHTDTHTNDTHIHAEMHLNQPIRSSRGSLITKTGSLPWPNEGVLTCKHTHAHTNTAVILVWLQTQETLIRRIHIHVHTQLHTRRPPPPWKQKHTQTQFKHTRGPNSLWVRWSKRMMLSVTAY